MKTTRIEKQLFAAAGLAYDAYFAMSLNDTAKRKLTRKQLNSLHRDVQRSIKLLQKAQCAIARAACRLNVEALRLSARKCARRIDAGLHAYRANRRQ